MQQNFNKHQYDWRHMCIKRMPTTVVKMDHRSYERLLQLILLISFAKTTRGKSNKAALYRLFPPSRRVANKVSWQFALLCFFRKIHLIPCTNAARKKISIKIFLFIITKKAAGFSLITLWATWKEAWILHMFTTLMWTFCHSYSNVKIEAIECL